jgi:RNA polymerase primary sigma factor
LQCLSERNAKILKLYYGIGGEELTLQEIGDRYQLSKERIRQIIRDSITRLRQQAHLN